MEKTDNFLNNQRYIFWKSEERIVQAVFLSQRIIEYAKISLIIFIIVLAFWSQDFQSFIILVVLLICIWVMMKWIQFIIKTFKLIKILSIVWLFFVLPILIYSYLLSHFFKYQTYKLKPKWNIFGNFQTMNDDYKSWTNGFYEIIKK